MATDSESFNRDLYDLLKVRGYKPLPLDSKNQRVAASQDSDVIEFQFTKDGEDYGKVWATVDDAQNLIIYYDSEQQDSPSTRTPGIDYDDTWTGLLKFLKMWAQRRQMSFELSNKDRLGDDMRQRDYYKMKEKLGESIQPRYSVKPTKYSTRGKFMVRDLKDHSAVGVYQTEEEALAAAENLNKERERKLMWGRNDDNAPVSEGYHPMGKKASYNDAVPNVKIILQHNRALEEGEQRYRNVARIYLENTDGERFLAPTNRPGVARVYARHIAEGGLPNDDRWNHIKSICEDYNKMAGFVRATRNGQFNESAQVLVVEGINHYNSLRETLHKMTGHRGYQAYFESWTPALMENEGDESINELFVQETMDPRIESAMPILSRLRKPVAEMSEVDTLAEWAEGILSEKLEMDEDTGESLQSNNPIGIPEGDVIPFKKKHDDEEDWDDDSWIPSIEDFEQEEEIRNRKPGPANDVNEMEKDLYQGSRHDPRKGPQGPDKTAKMLAAKKAIKDARKALDKAFNGDIDENFIGMAPQAVAEEEVDEAVTTWSGKGLLNKMRAANKAFKRGAAGWEKGMHDVDTVKAATKSLSPDQKEKALAAKAGKGSPAELQQKLIKREKPVEENLDANQKRVGQLGPTEKVKNNNIGKLVGASESTEIDPELARIIEMARFKR